MEQDRPRRCVCGGYEHRSSAAKALAAQLVQARLQELNQMETKVLQMAKMFDELVVANESLLYQIAEAEASVLEIGAAHRTGGQYTPGFNILLDQCVQALNDV